MRRLFLSTAALCAALAASTANAQMCQGYASFSAGQLRAGAGADFNGDITTIGGGLAFNPRNSKLYVGGTLGHASIDGIDEGAMGYGAQGGYQINLKTSRTPVQVCPVVGLDYMAGPNDVGGSGTDMSLMAFYGGVQAGARFRGSPSLDLVPTAGLAIEHATAKMSGTITADASDTYAVLSFGSGIVYNRNLTVLPSIEIPMGLEGSDTAFRISVNYNFMGAPARPATPAKRPARR